MKRLALIALALALVTAQPFAQTQTTPRSAGSTDSSSPIRSMLDTYCVTCHSTAMKAGGVVFAGMFFAVQSRRPPVVRFLLDHGADVNAMGDSGRSLLLATHENAEIAAMIRAAMPKDAAVDLAPLPR